MTDQRGTGAGPRRARRPTRAALLGLSAAAMLQGLCVTGPLAAETGAESALDRSGGRFHTRLQASTPAEGESLVPPLPPIRLQFSAPVEPSLTLLMLRFPTGDSVSLRARAVRDSTHLIRSELPALAPGSYVIEWSTVSVDGHSANGRIRFEVRNPDDAREADEPGPPVAEGAPPAADSGIQAPTAGLTGAEAVDSHRPPLRRTLFRGIGLAGLLAAAGLLWFAGGSGLVREPAVLRAASTTALIATVLLGLDYLDWLGNVRPAGLGLLEGLSAAIRTRTGLIDGARVLLAALVFFLAGGARAGRLAGLLAMIAVIIGAAAGHPAVIEPTLALPANALHLGAAAIWIGGVLLLAVLPDHPETPAGGWNYATVASRVSSRLFLAVGVILGTAFLQDLVFLGSIDNLTTTDYGRLLLGKAAGLVVLVGFGAWHRWKTLPNLVATGDQGALRLAVRIEIFVLVGVVLLAAWLGMIPPPAAG